MKKQIAWFELFLLVSASIAFSYMAHETDSVFQGHSSESTWVAHARNAFITFFGGNLVSAIDNVIWTCPLDTNGARCQEYGYLVCDGNCTAPCIQAERRFTNECREGTCFDPSEGTCAPNTPQSLCTEQGGTWDQRQMAEIPSCRPGCCLMGSQALFRTERACDTLRARFNVDVTFQPVNSEIECLALANRNDEGACVLDEVEPSRYGCKFGTGEQCTALGGTFYSGLLCSHPDLNTTCTKKTSTRCVNGKDEVYWFDSCGNRENIYYSIGDSSWNNGLILPKNQSCELGTVNNPLLHQSSCGNCNYLLGSRCGTPRLGDRNPSVGNFVCRDLSCSEGGKTYKHGESWCAFDSRIGVEGSSGSNGQRSVDVPGSQHYRKTCANGEISIEPCGTFRNQVCVESVIDTPDANDFSQAACRPNQWQLCYAANQRAEGISDPNEALRSVAEECNRHTDCYLKNVDLRGGRGTFAFNACLPKYPPAFDLQSNAKGEEAQALCAFGTTQCTYVRVKGFGSSKKYNEECITSLGAETMNNLCMSLGDCGASSNVAGEYTGAGFKSSHGQLRQAYVAGLRALKDPAANQRVEPLTENELALLFGLPEGARATPEMIQEKLFDTMMMISGVGGLALAGAIYYFGIEAIAIDVINPLLWSLGSRVSYLPHVIGGVLGAAAGALIGAAGVAYILDALGITAGLPPAVAYALIGLGAFAGGTIGFHAAAGAAGSQGAWISLSAGIWALVILVVIIAIFAFLGIGKKKETKVNFQCLPWQPPLGGNSCDTCGDNGLPCTKYKCQSLGQACRYLEDSADERCVNSGINDVASPVIDEDPAVLLSNYQYTQVSERGYHLQGPAAGGCVPRFEQIKLGILTNELAQCKVANTHTGHFDDMNEYFHRFNDRQNPLFRHAHTMTFSIPSNEAIENEQQIDDEFGDDGRDEQYSDLFLPDSSGNVNLYARCTDANGNKNLEEYTINFCVTEEPDRTAPLITRFSPATPAYGALGATAVPMNFWTNEPADCRWSETDQAYGVMANTATCLNGLADGTIQGWACNATLPAPASGSTSRTLYFRCKDKPWVNESEPGMEHERNANNQGAPYEIRATREALRITSVAPTNETIFVLGLPYRLNFTVTTAGGAEGQNRYCSYRIGSQLIRFFETGSDVHRQPGITLVSEGNYSYPLVCEDTVGNEARGEIRFSLEVDDEGPEITRVYNSNNRLTVITNEFARCAFSLSSCSFAFSNGTLMDGEQLVHSSSFTSDFTHHIYCRDLFDNPSGCTTVQGGTL